jgi:phosphoglycerate kinase
MQTTKLTAGHVKDKIVAIRVDFNVPLKNGKVSENTRIVESIPTLKFLLDNGAKRIHILSHLGRPKGINDPQLSLALVLPELEAQLGETVEFRGDFTPGQSQIQLHENVRFYDGEKKNDPAFIQELLNLGAEVFINDGFAVSHRGHASVIGLASYLPAFPGFLLQKEIDHLTPFLSDKKMPGLAVVVGGAKIETKVKVLEHFAKTADNILIGGALANTFLAAQGQNVGASFYEDDQLEVAQRILKDAEKNNTTIYLPVDVTCGEAMDSAQTVTVSLEGVSDDNRIFDIGPETIKNYQAVLNKSQTIIWNGPLGCFEYPGFAAGTKQVLKTIAALKSTQTILGGGDTLDALKKFGVNKSAFTHVSTGGGAMLEFLEGKELPGIEVLKS